MLCKNCGREITEGSGRFCLGCGADLSAATERKGEPNRIIGVPRQRDQRQKVADGKEGNKDREEAGIPAKEPELASRKKDDRLPEDLRAPAPEAVDTDRPEGLPATGELPIKTSPEGLKKRRITAVVILCAAVAIAALLLFLRLGRTSKLIKEAEATEQTTKDVSLSTGEDWEATKELSEITVTPEPEETPTVTPEPEETPTPEPEPVPEETPMPVPTEEPVHTDDDLDGVEMDMITETATEPDEPNHYASAGWENSGYGAGEIFPDSSFRLLTDEEIQYLSKEHLQYAINEIWARNGYIFSDREWLDYYLQFSWYTPTISKEEWTAAGQGAYLNSTEVANVDKLAKYRNS